MENNSLTAINYFQCKIKNQRHFDSGNLASYKPRGNYECEHNPSSTHNLTGLQFITSDIRN